MSIKWKRKAIKQFDGERLYYVRDTRNVVGNCVLWWRKGNAGYTCNLDEAEIYTKSIAMRMHRSRKTDRPYPKDIIDGMCDRHVDHQKIDHIEYTAVDDNKGASP